MDRYELGESIGEGAFGIVFLAHQKGTQIKVGEDDDTADFVLDCVECRLLILAPHNPDPLPSLATHAI
jgi:serine/threonine protein kinase